ncbi:Receptor homology region, transmembrane domain- and RING domain-containing protein 1 [Cardamine amara subsp. amara]|uniref:Receptor homology region, transmembrane domain-and RING domain-containing protein 1 n=1 Tax=Cardamine amara subsp. amara TaxID=228776 RepID=A0ABD1A5E7_CARAN
METTAVNVNVNVTHKVVPYDSAPLTTESELEKTCAICLENMLGRLEDHYEMPNCSHCFHEDCVIEWLERANNSCPLCRQPVYEESDIEEEAESEGED